MAEFAGRIDLVEDAVLALDSRAFRGLLCLRVEERFLAGESLSSGLRSVGNAMVHLPAGGPAFLHDSSGVVARERVETLDRVAHPHRDLVGLRARFELVGADHHRVADVLAGDGLHFASELLDHPNDRRHLGTPLRYGSRAAADVAATANTSTRRGAIGRPPVAHKPARWPAWRAVPAWQLRCAAAGRRSSWSPRRLP